MMNNWWYAPCLFLVMICGFSQVVSTQTIPKSIRMESERKEKVKVSTAISLGGSYQTGNTENGSVLLSSAVSAMDSIKEFSLNAKYHYSENARKMNKEEFSGGLQFDYRPLSRFSPFVRGEFYSNQFRQIDSRFSGLLGAKYCYFKYLKDNIIISEYSISGAFVFENDNYTKEALLSDKSRVRLSLRPKFKQIVMKNIFLGLECFYKPNIVDFNDFIIDSMFQINFVVNEHVTLSCSYQYEYDSKPATATVKKTDTNLLASLMVKF